MIKRIYKNKKGLLVFETNDENERYFTVIETTLKGQVTDKYLYPLNSKNDYLKEKKLKKISYGEFYDEFEATFNKVRKQVNSLTKKLSALTNEFKNSEYRHFVFESKSKDELPLMTERVLVPAKIALELYVLAYNKWNSFVLSLINEEILDDNDEFKIKLDPKYETLAQTLYTKHYVHAVAVKGRYTFDDSVDDVIDNLPDTDNLIFDDDEYNLFTATKQDDEDKDNVKDDLDDAKCDNETSK